MLKLFKNLLFTSALLIPGSFIFAAENNIGQDASNADLTEGLNIAKEKINELEKEIDGLIFYLAQLYTLANNLFIIPSGLDPQIYFEGIRKVLEDVKLKKN